MLNFALFGTGTSSQSCTAAFAKAAGIEVAHVPYKGTADAARDLLEGCAGQALSTPSVKDTIARGAYEASPGSPAELAADIRSAYDRWGTMIWQMDFVKQ